MDEEIDQQWTSIEPEIRDTLAPLPDADEFTPEDIGRIILRVKRVNRDVLSAIERGD